MATRRRTKKQGEQTFVHYRVKNFVTYLHLTDDDGAVIDSKEIRFENGVLNTSDSDIIEALEAHQDYGIHLLNVDAFEQRRYHQAQEEIDEVIETASDEALDAFLTQGDKENGS